MSTKTRNYGISSIETSISWVGWVAIHDDVIKWRHFPRHWPFVRGIYRPPMNFPHKAQWRGALMFSLICAWINGWVNNCKAGDLSRHRAHYDDTVMNWYYLVVRPCIIVRSLWARWRLKSPALRWFAQPFVQAQIKENTKTPLVFFVRGIHRWVARKMYPFDYVIMRKHCWLGVILVRGDKRWCNLNQNGKIQEKWRLNVFWKMAAIFAGFQCVLGLIVVWQKYQSITSCGEHAWLIL